jgi:hypothetical protein
MKNNILRIALVTSTLLMIPLLGRWSWTLGDFIVMGALIFGTGLAVSLAMTKIGKNRYIAAVAIILLFLWLWAELAVGIFTNWGS